MRDARGGPDEGFTLFETLAAVAAMGAIVAGLALITGQWLPSWRHGFANLQRAELAGLGLDRVAADFAAAEYIRLDALSPGPLFAGERQSATFVRESLDPNAPPGLEIVRYAEVQDASGFAMVRARAPFRPGERNPAFDGPVVVARSPFRLGFAYADPNRAWVETWPDGFRLPSAVRITIRDAATGSPLAASTAMLLHVTAPAPSQGAAPGPGNPKE
jgi:general secretion pathway protein J